MSPIHTRRTTPKPTLLSTHPLFTTALIEIILDEFRSVRKFSALAGIENSRLYAFLREGEKGAVPRLHTVTTLLRTVRKHAPHRFESLMEALRSDIESDPEPSAEKQFSETERNFVFTDEELARIWQKTGWTIPRPSIAKRFKMIELKAE